MEGPDHGWFAGGWERAVRRQLTQLDRGLVVVLMAIVLLGLYNLSSASKPLGASLHWTHVIHLCIGFGAAAMVASFHYRNLEGLAYPLFFATVGLLVATMLFGKVVNGSRRWLSLGFMNLQTSDLAKLAVIVVVARIFHLERWEGSLTLREIFRPMNLSRPLALVAGVLTISLAGDDLSAPRLEKVERGRPRVQGVLSRDQATLELGRVGDVRMPYAKVEGIHARVFRLKDGLYQLMDLDSKAGTFLNGEKVAGPVTLRNGDQIRLGSSPRAELKFSAFLLEVRPWLPGLALVGMIWLAAAFVVQSRKGRWSARDVAAPIDVVALPCALILVQPDLGTTLMVLLIAFSMILFVGLRPSSLLSLIGGSAAFGVVAWFSLLKPYQKERVRTFLNPASDLAGAGYHQHQSLIAIGSGEWFGKGHGQGTQTQLSFLPEQQTDFIFSVWAEEHGFVGCLLVVGLYAALILLCLRIALRARDRFGALLVVGVTSTLFWHTAVNMLMVLRLAPVVGVPLPLWSNGGSFVLTTMVGLGLVAGIDMRRKMF